jgi:hypothetical protein
MFAGFYVSLPICIPNVICLVLFLLQLSSSWAPGEKSETAELLEMVQKVSDSSQSPSPRAIQSSLAIAKQKVAKMGKSQSRRVEC